MSIPFIIYCNENMNIPFNNKSSFLYLEFEAGPGITMTDAILNDLKKKNSITWEDHKF